MFLNGMKSFDKLPLTWQDMIDHRSYADNLSSCEIKAWKNLGLNGIRTHMVQCSELLSHLGAGHIVSS